MAFDDYWIFYITDVCKITGNVSASLGVRDIWLFIGAFCFKRIVYFYKMTIETLTCKIVFWSKDEKYSGQTTSYSVGYFF